MRQHSISITQVLWVRQYPAQLIVALMIVAGLVSFPSVLQAHPQELAEIIAKAKPSVVKVEVEAGRGTRSQGSGFIVESQGVFVTNVRVLAGASKASVVLPSGKVHEIEGTYYVDQARDICIAQLKDARNLPTLKLTVVDPVAGSKVATLGLPGRGEFSATPGVVKGMRDGTHVGRVVNKLRGALTVDGKSVGFRGNWVEVDGELSPGDNGGPVVNDRGVVVAMSSMVSQGENENVSFGISAKEIGDALRVSDVKPLISLEQGIGTVILGHEGAAGGGGAGGEVVPGAPIPQAALTEYAMACRSNWTGLCKFLRRSVGQAEEEWRAMKKGRVNDSLNWGYWRTVSRNRNISYQFQSQRIKDRETRQQEAKLKKLKSIKAKLTDTPTDAALLELMKVEGVILDPQVPGSIGLLRGATVGTPIDGNTVIAQYDGLNYLLWVQSTVGLYEGTDINPKAVYVAGSKMVADPVTNRKELMTVLKTATDIELQQAVMGEEQDAKPSDDGEDLLAARKMRTWTSRLGTWKTEGVFVSSDGKNIMIRRPSGETRTVALASLSQADLDYVIEQRKKK